MKIDYAALISPFPLHLQEVGNIRCPTLRDIWNPDVTYNGYNLYLSLLSMDLQTYCTKINPMLSEWFTALPDDEKSKMNVFDIISSNKEVREQYKQLLEFFFVENIHWDNEAHVYFTYMNKDENGQIIPFGMIHKGIWNEICDVILQRCGVNRNITDEIDESKVKSKRALEILKKIKDGKKKMAENNKYDKNTELPNLISKVAVKAKSINFINIWDLTVFQLYEQFKQECSNVFFDISTMSIAAWGNEKKAFKGNEWYKHEN